MTVAALKAAFRLIQLAFIVGRQRFPMYGVDDATQT